MRRMRGVVEDAVNCRSILIGSLGCYFPTRVAVSVEAWEVAARNLQPDTVAC